jgi:hypothetical protein
LVLLVVVAVAGVVVAVTGAAKPVPGLAFLQAGHWIASPALGLVVHVDGADRKPDAEVALPNVEPGSQVVQGETSGYVVGRASATEFGKSTLTVEGTTPLPRSGKRPVPVEIVGGPYVVYTDIGTVVRFGPEPLTVSANGPVGPPVTTSDGSVWLHRTDSGAVCRLARGASSLACPAVAPAGHAGGLTVSGDKPVFVDFTDDTMSTVEADGLGDPVRVGFDVPPTAALAPADVAGKVAVLDPVGDDLYLVDAALDGAGRLGGERPQATKVDLPAGEYAGPSVTGEAVVLLDHDRASVRTYGSDGSERKATPIPAEKGKPELVRGDDARVYVDGGEGKHVVVVDRDGSVNPVPVVGVKPEDRRQPSSPPNETTTTAKPADPPPQQPVQPAPGRTTQPPVRRPDPTTQPPPPPPIVATPPGIPGNLAVNITTQQTDATVTWSAAAPNGAPVTAYHLSWQRDDGSRAGAATVPAGTLSHVVPGIWSGADIPFTVTVVAENSAGRGTPASVRTVPPVPTRTITLSQGARSAECGQSNCYWMHVVMSGFEPGSMVNVFPYSTDPNYSNVGHGQRIDENGNVDLDAF